MDRRGFLRTGAAAGVAAMVAPMLVGRGREGAYGEVVRTPGGRAENVIRLDSNENALGMAPSAREAVVNALGGANRYPFAQADELSGQLAEHHGVSPGCILLGCGSAEILQIVTQATAAADALVIMADPTFEAVADYASAASEQVLKVPLRADFSHDIPKMKAEAAAHKGPVLVYICNPNNPTGTITDCGEIERWVRQAPDRITFLIDEAYYQFVRDSSFFSFSEMAAKHSNLVVAHTFSKVYAMAGMRMGYSISTPETARRLAPFSTGLSVNHLALAAASASLKDEKFLKDSLAANERSRGILLKTLEDLEIEHLPSETNFVMFRLKGGIVEFNRQMAGENIRVGRPFPPLVNYCRITLGLESEMETFSQALRGFRKKGFI